MPLQALARGWIAEQREALIEPLDLGFGFHQMLLEQFAAAGRNGPPSTILGSALVNLLLGMQDVAEFIDQQLAGSPPVPLARNFPHESEAPSVTVSLASWNAGDSTNSHSSP